MGEYDTVYRSVGARGGEVGSPFGNYVTVVDNPNGAGAGQQFELGTIYSSDAGTFAVAEPIRAEYWSEGSDRGLYGWPTSAQKCSEGFCAQEYQGGVIGYSTSTQSFFVVDEDYLDVFRTSGGLKDGLGVPLGPRVEVSDSANGPGAGQQFSNGTTYSSDAGGFAVSGAVRSAFWTQGSVGGPLGLPIGSQVTVASPNGKGGGQTITSGTLYESVAGVFPVAGAIRAEYWRLGSNEGSLGWPVADPVCVEGLCSQEFQGGSITR